MSIEPVETNQPESIKDRLVMAIVSLSDPVGEIPESSVQDFLLREQFQETYQEVLQLTAPTLAEELLVENKDIPFESLAEEGKKFALWMDKGREAFELILDSKTKTDTDVNMMNFWKKRGVADETIEPEKYGKSIAREPLSGFARSIQAHPVSKQEKVYFLYGGFTWALARGKPKEAINCLEYIARIKKDTTASLISSFEPVLSFMHKLVGDLDQDVVNTKGGLDVIGGRPAGEYLLEVDQAMMEQGYQFDENHAIKPLPIPVT